MSSFISGKKQKICLICNREQTFFDPDSIVMFWVKEKQLKIHMIDGSVYTCYGTLKKIEEKVTEYRFFRSYKSYLVNIDHIKSIKNEYGEKEIEFDCIRERAILSRRKMKELNMLLKQNR